MRLELAHVSAGSWRMEERNTRDWNPQVKKKGKSSKRQSIYIYKYVSIRDTFFLRQLSFFGLDGKADL